LKFLGAHVTAPAVATAADRAQAGGPAIAHRVIGEDVVDLVAAAAGAAQPPDVGAIAVGVLELYLGLGVGLHLLVIGLVFGQTEVDERSMPGVAEGHDRVKGFVPCRDFPARNYAAPAA
jgi:hypothetical protein